MIGMISAFDMLELRRNCRFLSDVSVYLSIMASNNLQKSSAIQNNSVTLSSVSIAIIVAGSLIIQRCKDTTVFANHQLYRTIKIRRASR